MFVPEIGNCYVIADYSQIELRVSAELSGDKTMQDAFVRGQDLHKLTASKAFGVSEEEVRTSFKGGPYSDRQLHYAASDLVQTGELWNSYASSLNGHFDIVKLECDIIPLVASAELAGMKIDPSRLDSLKKEAQKTKTNLEEQLPWMGSSLNSALKPIPEAERLNPNSPKPVSYTHLTLPTIYSV